jgi:hypothetical protein
MATASTETFPQYAGELFMLGNGNTPFQAALGSEARLVSNFDFAVSSSWTIASGSQQAITETDALTQGTPANYTRDQDVNTCQIVKYDVVTTYKMLSSYNKLIGNSSDYGSIDGINAIDDVHNHNTTATLKQIYTDLNYCSWNGSYTRSTGAGVAAQTRGLVEAISTHDTAMATVSGVTKDDIDNHLAGMADAGVDMSGIVIWVGSTAKIKLSNLYSLNLQTQPRDRQVGGVNLQTLVTDFGEFGIGYDAHVPSNSIYFINMPYVKNVWCLVPEKGGLFYEEKPTAGAARSGMLYGQWGLDYGAEEMHGVMRPAS